MKTLYKLKLLVLSIIIAASGTQHLNAQLALDLAGPGNYTSTTYTLNTGGFTIEYDMYIHSHQDFNAGVTFTCGNSPAPIDFYVTSAGTPNSLVGNCVAFHSIIYSAITAGAWHNFAFSYPGGNNPILVYIDGILVGTHVGFQVLPGFTATSFRIGDRVDGVTNSNAKYDNVKIWSVARTQAEIQADMNACETGNEPGLDILYRMEEGSGTTIYDLALGNGAQDGTITGTASWTEGITTYNTTNITPSACGSYLSPSGNYTWNSSGIYSDTLSNINGCDSVLIIDLTIIPNPVVQTSPSDISICPGNTVQISTSALGNPVPFILGTGTDSNSPTSYPAPYGNYYYGAKHQILVLASELQALGLTAGVIGTIAFDVENHNDGDSLVGFNIGMDTTSLTSLTDFVQGIPTVYSTSYYEPVNGWNPYTVYFNWDGVSNIIIETCFNNTDYEYNASTYYTATSFTSVVYNIEDDQGVCAEPFASNSSSDRPNIRFEQYQSIISDYIWSPSAGLDNDIISNPVFSGNSSTVYTVTVTEVATGCTSTNTVSVNVLPVPTVAVTPVDTTICQGNTVQLMTSATGNSGSVILGTGTSYNDDISYPAPYGNYYYGAKHQILVLASELLALGLAPNPITSIAFDVAATNGTDPLEDFTIGMDATSVNSITDFIPGIPTVYTSSFYAPVNGWNPHAINFNWDGVSNIIIEICFNNADYTNNSSTRYTPTTFSSVVYYEEDDSGVCAVLNSSSQSVDRPNMKFTGTSGVSYLWSPSANLDDATIANPEFSGNASELYTVTVTDQILGCIKTTTATINVTVVDASVTNNSPMLTANTSGATYQWVDCNNSFAPIAGATNQSFTATSNGMYAVIVTENDCSNTSACETVANVGIDPNSFGAGLSAFPNPTNGYLTINLGNLYSEMSLSLKNELGQVIMSRKFDSVDQLNLFIDSAPGIYFIELMSEDGQQKVLRIVKY